MPFNPPHQHTYLHRWLSFTIFTQNIWHDIHNRYLHKHNYYGLHYWFNHKINLIIRSFHWQPFAGFLLTTANNITVNLKKNHNKTTFRVGLIQSNSEDIKLLSQCEHTPLMCHLTVQYCLYFVLDINSSPPHSARTPLQATSSHFSTSRNTAKLS